MLTCPSCQSSDWPANTRGLRSCPDCKATLRFTTVGVSVYRDSAEVIGALRAQGKRARLLDRKPINGVIDYERYLSVMRQRLYHVPSDDMTVLCAMCSKRCDVSEALDGAITLDKPQRIDVQIGETVDGKPITETRLIHPSNVRGMLCQACVQTFHARPIRSQNAETDKRRANDRGTRVMPAHYNTARQRIEADIAALEIERARRNFLDSGMPVWAAENAAIEVTGIGAEGALYSQTFRGYWLGPSVLAYLEAVQAGKRKAREPKQGTVWRPEDWNDLGRNLTTVRQAIAVSIARQKHRQSRDIALGLPNPLPVTPWSAFSFWPILSRPSGSPKGKPITASLALWREWLASPCHWPRPLTGKFSSRPLPRRAIPLTPVR